LVASTFKDVVTALFASVQDNIDLHLNCEVTKITHNNKSTDEYLTLSLMVLGEALASTKTSIVEKAGLYVPGWYSEDIDGGWGPSHAVCRAMGRPAFKWCSRAIYILQN